MKKIAKKIIVLILAGQIKKLRAKHDFKVVAVVGSIGKTSTKFATASVLSQKYRVRFQEGNYNDLVTVPLVFFGQDLPSLFNPFAWAKVIMSNARQIKRDYPYDVVLVELGIDGPGQMAEFAQYLNVDIAVVTALTAEHMEFLGNIDTVAFEELSVGGFSEKIFANADFCPPKYLNEVPTTTYAIHADAALKITEASFNGSSYEFRAEKRGKPWLSATHKSVSELQLYSLLAAACVGDSLGMTSEELVAGFEKFDAVSGRMQLLSGINNSTIIDDTYNSSPEAVKAALDTLYQLDAPQRIALLGNMNELGDYSTQAHQEIGEYCDPAKLNLLVTLSGDANEITAKVAEAKGCKVIRTNSPKEAAEQIRQAMKPGAVILAKGSQNRVFAEEAVKELLQDPSDAVKLVRQSADWLKLKEAQFA